jgi:hypothetical protein
MLVVSMAARGQLHVSWARQERSLLAQADCLSISLVCCSRVLGALRRNQFVLLEDVHLAADCALCAHPPAVTAILSQKGQLLVPQLNLR